MTDGGERNGSDLGDGFGPRYRHARSKLGGAQKSAVGVPAYLRFVNRKAGGWLASVGFGLGWTPNHLTFLSALCSWAGIAVLAAVDPSPPVAVAVVALLLLGYAFDSGDGQLSRVRGGGRPSGEWLDHVVDTAKTASLHAGVAVSLYRFPDGLDHRWLLLPLAFGIVHVTFFFGMMLRDQLGARPERGEPGDATVAKSLALLPLDYGSMCAIFVLRPWPTAFVIGYGVLFVYLALFSARSLTKAYRLLDHDR